MTTKKNLDNNKIWEMSQRDKMPYHKIAYHFNVSETTIFRRLKELKRLHSADNENTREDIKIIPPFVPLNPQDKLILSPEPVPLSPKEFLTLSRARIKELKVHLEDMPIIPPTPKIQKGKEDAQAVLVGDWHAGSKAMDEQGREIFNDPILLERLDKFSLATDCLFKNWILRGGNITDIYLLCVGDLVDGAGIFEEQQYLSTMAPPKQVMFVVDALKRMILMFLSYGVRVHFKGVMGNHGEIRRAGKIVHPLNNWDFMVFLVLDMWQRDVLKDEKFTIEYSELKYLNFKIKSWGYHIRHMAPVQLETPSGKAKFLAWHVKHHFDVLCCGHKHHPAWDTKNNLKYIRSGALTASNDLSESMGEEDAPAQLTWRVTDTRPSTEIYPIDLIVGV